MILTENEVGSHRKVLSTGGKNDLLEGPICLLCFAKTEWKEQSSRQAMDPVKWFGGSWIIAILQCRGNEDGDKYFKSARIFRYSQHRLMLNQGVEEDFKNGIILSICPELLKR